MRLIWKHLFGILILAMVSACIPAEQDMPDDFSLIFAWDTGSLPPRYRYEYVITIGPGPQGEFEYVPGYGDKNNPEFWVTSLTISEEDMRSLFDYFYQHGFMTNKWKTGEISVGGSNTTMIITAFGKEYRVPSISSLEGENLRKVESAQDTVRMVVPDSIWEEMESRQSIYENKNTD